MAVELEILTKSDLAELRQLLIDLKEMLSNGNTNHKQYLREKELRKELGGVSANTVMKWRVEGKLHPKRIGRVLFYSWEEIEKILS